MSTVTDVHLPEPHLPIAITPSPAPQPAEEIEREHPKYRALRVYAFDPSRGRRLGNYMTVRVKWETLENELRGKQLHVIDYDATNKRYYKPAKLNSESALIEGGYEPSESDPRFHQQMVYAVAMQTIDIFEKALGRDIVYSFNRQEDANHLRVFPHAMSEPNAYYSRELGALLFGYFKASLDDAGSGLPGGTVFNCLSHDIVAHETTHSIIDTLRSSFMEPSNPDVPAFHEAFADIVALFQHFSFEDVVRDTLRRSGGILHRFNLTPRGGNGKGDSEGNKIFIVGEMPEGNPLLDLARQFGESMGRRSALRSALGIPPDPHALDKATEPHERGAVLVAAVFDAFFSAFMERSADLIRLARAASGGSDDIHPDVAARLAKEAARTAQHFCTMCIRAIDYCPPVDITFGEFLRALITADTMLYASDEHDYRETLIAAFRARGIYPEGVVSLAEESLLWDKPMAGTPICPGLKFNLLEPDHHLENNRKELEATVRTNPFCFGLCEDDSHSCSTCTCKVSEDERVVKSVNTVIRGGEQRPKVEFVGEIVRTVALDKDHPDEKFSGGSTVVFDSAGHPIMVVYKKLSSRWRRENQVKRAQAAIVAAPTYVDSSRQMRLSSIHRGC